MEEITPKRRRGNPNWYKGIPGNPNGRPRNAEIDKLREAIKFGEKKFGIDIFRHAIERAFRNDIVLVALLKKILPDKIEQSGVGDITKILIVREGKTDDKANRIPIDEETNRSV